MGYMELRLDRLFGSNLSQWIFGELYKPLAVRLRRLSQHKLQFIINRSM